VQAASLKAHIASQSRPLSDTLQLVVVSPLTRALETAVAAFGGDCPAAPGAPLLMRAQEALPEQLRVARPGVSALGAPPFVACELCREHLGVHPCDRRRALSYYRAAYPAVDWSLIEHEEDTLWDAEVRETDEELALRAKAFLRWLLARPEQHIAVVTHSSWLSIMFLNFTGACSAPAGESMKRWFQNAEVRAPICPPALGWVCMPARADAGPPAAHRGAACLRRAGAPRGHGLHAQHRRS